MKYNGDAYVAMATRQVRLQKKKCSFRLYHRGFSLQVNKASSTIKLWYVGDGTKNPVCYLDVIAVNVTTPALPKLPTTLSRRKRVAPKQPAPSPKDSDKDGMPDSQDNCPQRPGPRKNQGCPWPDTDADGLHNKLDRCPKRQGPEANQGCPWPDADLDGVPDRSDHCPQHPGMKKFNGCPDSDLDGIHDGVDQCQRKWGPKASRGCPILHPNPHRRPRRPSQVRIKWSGQRRGVIQLPRPLQFMFGRLPLSYHSKQHLKKVAQLLKDNTRYRLTVAVRFRIPQGFSAGKVWNGGFASWIARKQGKQIQAFLASQGLERKRISVITLRSRGDSMTQLQVRR